MIWLILYTLLLDLWAYDYMTWHQTLNKIKHNHSIFNFSYGTCPGRGCSSQWFFFSPVFWKSPNIRFSNLNLSLLAWSGTSILEHPEQILWAHTGQEYLEQDRKSTDCDTLTPWRIIIYFFLSHLKLNLLSLTACRAVHGAYHFHILMPFYTILILCHFHTQAPFPYPDTISVP